MAINEGKQPNRRTEPVSVTKSSVAGDAVRGGSLSSNVQGSVVTRAAARKDTIGGSPTDHQASWLLKQLRPWHRRRCCSRTSPRPKYVRAPQRTFWHREVRRILPSCQASIRLQRSASSEGDRRLVRKMHGQDPDTYCTLQSTGWPLRIGLTPVPRLTGLGRSQRSQRPSDRGVHGAASGLVDSGSGRL